MRVDRPVCCWRGLWLALVLLSCPLATPVVAQEVAVDIGHTLAAHGATSARGRGEFYFNRDLAQALVEKYAQRMTPAQRQRFDALLSGGGQ